MKNKNEIVRGGFHFIKKNENIICWLGEPDNPESEFIFEVHEFYVKDLVAGLTAIKNEV